MGASFARAADPVFEKNVLPIFTKYCFNCHGKSSPQLGLDLRSARLTMRGSQNGPVITKGSPEKSLLWQKLIKREMPLAQFKLRLSDAELETVRLWIATGAKTTEPAKLPADVQEQFARFEKEVKPIFVAHCVDCHSEDDPEGELDLSSLESLVRGSQSGPVIVEGFSDKSVLIRKVASHKMPPPDLGEPLTAKQIKVITRWIDKGRFADYVDVTPRSRPSDESVSDTVTDEDRQFWAFQPPAAVKLPIVQQVDRIRTPIDQFILAKLEAHNSSFSPDASKLKLIRRAYFDLIGLPPSPDRVRQFLKDESPDAYDRLIDELLASPHYGERWGRHWLDAVGYVDTSGKDHSPTSVTLSDGYWRYRDYVIQATNKDTPWNQFLIEQIAGDELVDWRNEASYSKRTLDLLTATGFLRNVLDATDEDISNLPFDRYEALFMLMDRVSTSTMGMTLACARCHSHKFDPIPQTDYYRFLSIFTAAYNPSDWLPPKRRHLYTVSNSEHDEIKRRQGEVSRLKSERTKIQSRYRDQLLTEKLKSLPDADREAAKAAVQTDAKKRNDSQKKLVETYGEQLTVKASEINAAINAADQSQMQELVAQQKEHEAFLARQSVNKLQALWDVGDAPTIRLLHRGDVDFAGPKVSPGFLSVLSQPGHASATPSTNSVGKTSGLRLAFAEWLTRPDHPLTARVVVNRIWQHHFGTGIVATPDNFGATGARPTHPELLDWLAVEFVQNGWSAKRLHKLIMTSTVYRQASRRATDSSDSNQLLSRMNLRRLEAESLRDAVVAVSGQANYTMGGRPILLKTSKTGLQEVGDKNAPAGAFRRSGYLLARRANPLTMLQVFDFPVIDVNCTRRSESATPLQSLTMINSQFFTNSAVKLAERIQRESEDSLNNKISNAYWLALSRPPTQQEQLLATEYITQLRELYQREEHAKPDDVSLQNFVHMLLCTNEFLYVD